MPSFYGHRRSGIRVEGISAHPWSGKLGNCGAGIGQKRPFPPSRGSLQPYRAACDNGMMQWEPWDNTHCCSSRSISPSGLWISVTSWPMGSCRGWLCAARVSAAGRRHGEGLAWGVLGVAKAVLQDLRGAPLPPSGALQVRQQALPGRESCVPHHKDLPLACGGSWVVSGWLQAVVHRRAGVQRISSSAEKSTANGSLGLLLLYSTGSSSRGKR